MIRSRTQENGTRTRGQTENHSLDIANKEDGFEYSFRRKKYIDQGGGMDREGFQPVGAENSNGETWGGPKFLQHRGASKTIQVDDVILCKRKEEVGEYFRKRENAKYNAQVRMVKNSCADAREKLRKLDPGSTIINNSKGFEGMTQRTGPTEEEHGQYR